MFCAYKFRFPLPGPAQPFNTDTDTEGDSSGLNTIRSSGSNITHVFKHGGSWHDAYVVGRYDDGPLGSMGTWTTYPMPDGGNPRTQMGTAINVGAAYAAKDFLDTRLKGRERRILWTWGFGLPGLLIPREITWDAALMQLVFSPLEEFAQLRTGPLPLQHNLNGSALAPNENRMISDSWEPKGAGNCSELIVRFEAPPHGCAARFGVGLLLGSGHNTSVFVEWQEPPTAADRAATVQGGGSWTARVGVGSPDPQHYNSTVMQGVELSADWSASCLDPAGSGRWSVHENWTCLNDTCNPHGCCTPTNKTIADCEAACESSDTCVAWTFYPVAGGGFHWPCGLLDGFPKVNIHPDRESPSAPVSGIRRGVTPPRFADPDMADGLATTGGGVVELRIFVDGDTLEVFFNGGRVNIAWNAGGGDLATAGVSLFNYPLLAGGVEGDGGGSCPVTVRSVQAFTMGTIWGSRNR